MQSFNEYLTSKRIYSTLKESVDSLLDKGIDPVAFYEELLEGSYSSKDELLNEIGWLQDLGAGLGAGFSSFGAKGRAVDAVKALKFLDSPEAKSRYSPEQIAQYKQQVEKDRATAAQQAGQGFFQNFGTGYRANKLDRRFQDIEAKYGPQQQQQTQQQTSQQPQTSRTWANVADSLYPLIKGGNTQVIKNVLTQLLGSINQSELQQQGTTPDVGAHVPGSQYAPGLQQAARPQAGTSPNF